jgi:hypothetical protein
MCIDQKMIRQQLNNAKKVKYEMGNFCEQFEIASCCSISKKYIGRSLIRFSERNLFHITIVTRKENLINLQRIFLKNPKQRILNLINIFQKENVSVAENQNILLISVINLPKKLKKNLIL